MRRFLRHDRGGFTLVEMLVSITVLTLLILIITRLLNSASTMTTLGNKRIDSDNQARPMLDRMANDFNQIVKRADVDYYLKVGSAQTGNDQLAFFSTVPGYYPSNGSQSPISLVGYRINSTNKLERLSNGLLWNGVSATDAPVVFLPVTISGTWPAATTNNENQSDPVVKNYEVIGPQIFRFEYYYQLQQGDLSVTPWDTGQNHDTVSGLRDVGAIVVVIAAIDPQSRVLLSNTQLSNLAEQLVDYSVYKPPGNSGKVGPALTALWQAAVNKNTLKLPPTVLAGIRFYQRYFCLNGTQQ